MRQHLLRLLKHSLAFGILLLLLPFTGCRGFPLHKVLGGLFIDHTFLGGMLASAQLVGTAWSLMFCQGLVIGAAQLRFGNSLLPDEAVIDENYKNFFNIPITRKQLICYSMLALPGLFMSARFAKGGPWSGALAALTGCVLAFIVWQLLFLPSMIGNYKENDKDTEYLSLFPLSYYIFIKLWNPFLPELIKIPIGWIYNLAMKILKKILRLKPPGSRFKANGGETHYVQAFTIFLPILLAYISAGLVSETIRVPAVFYFYTLFALCIWFLTAVDFLSSLVFQCPFPGVLLVLTLAVVGNALLGVGHVYWATFAHPTPQDVKLPLDPVNLVKLDPASRNLVVVTSSGGGIYAAGWTLLMLKRLEVTNPGFLAQTRLVSTVSGSSVAMAFLAEERMEHPDASPVEVLDSALDRATRSSLPAVARGLAYADFWRLASFGLWPRGPDAAIEDRARLMERSWMENAGCSPGQPRALTELRECVRNRQLPALVMNASIMETGDRVMFTAVDLPPAHQREERLLAGRYADPQRALTHSELMRRDADGGFSVDLSLWTAARLSATFPYVTPIARCLEQPGAGPWADGRHLHLCDGGYVDNFGVASAMDWLTPVLEARAGKGAELGFDKVLVVQLRAFRNDPAEPAVEASATFTGPIHATLAERDGILDRNDIELGRFLENWRQRLADRKVRLETMVLQPDGTEEAGPLSWHMTNEDFGILDKSGDPYRQDKDHRLVNPQLGKSFDWIQAYLRD